MPDWQPILKIILRELLQDGEFVNIVNKKEAAEGDFFR
jgi:hypothetical protein